MIIGEQKITAVNVVNNKTVLNTSMVDHTYQTIKYLRHLRPLNIIWE